MRTGISSYSYSRLVGSGAMHQTDVVLKAKEMGFDFIEFSAFLVPEGETRFSFAEKLKSECVRVGIDVVNYAVSADLINGSGGDPEKEIEKLKDELKIAGVLGARSMRHDATAGYPPEYRNAKGFDDLLPLLAASCRKVTSYAESLGIRTMVENHGYICQDSERLEKLVNAVNHPNFGALIDIGNFSCVDERSEEAVGRLAPYAFHVHAKDFHIKSGMLPDPGKGWFRSRGGNYLRGAIIGHGDIPVAQCLGILKAKGYKGDISIEFEGIEDPMAAIPIGFDNLKRYMN